MSLKRDAADWQEKVFKMIVFFALLGCCVLGGAAWMINNTFSHIFSESNPAPPNSSSSKAHP